MSDRRRVALTFDAEHPDRPGCPPGNAARILDDLAATGTRATFFVQGRWALSAPDVARRIADEGHLVGHHSHYHARMTMLDADGVRADVEEAHEAIVRTTGVDPAPWFRCPFGAGHDDPTLLARLEALGYRNVHWDVEVEDWEPWRTGAAIADDALRGIDAHGDGAIVLLHTWPVGTADAIRPLLDGLDELGAEAVRLDELGAPA